MSLFVHLAHGTTEISVTLPHPPSLSLHPFQEEAVGKMLHFLRTNEANGVYQASEMGTGKTILSVVTANALTPSSILVICPASVILNWVAELKKWSTTPYEYLPVLKSTHLKDVKRLCYGVVLISYDMAKTKKGVDALLTRKWDLLILDEAHKLKGRKTHRALAILGPIWKQTKYRIALSGTPITDSVVDAFTLFSKFSPSIFKNFYEFANLFANVDRTAWGDKFYGIKNADKLKSIIRSKFFVRYTKEDAKLDLPPKTFTKIILPYEYAFNVAKSDEDKLKEEVEILRQAIENGKALPLIPTSLAGQRKEQALKKLPPIIEFIEDLLEQGIPIVVFTYHTEVLLKLESAFKQYNPALIHGATAVKYRESAVKDFQDGKTNLFLGQIVAAGVGITLTRSSTVIFAELDWSAVNVAQCIDRCHRIGAKYPVNIYYFSVEKSLEERIIDTVVRKTKVFSKLMEN